jgi:hypothetical protein
MGLKEELKAKEIFLIVGGFIFFFAVFLFIISLFRDIKIRPLERMLHPFCSLQRNFVSSLKLTQKLEITAKNTYKYEGHLFIPTTAIK